MPAPRRSRVLTTAVALLAAGALAACGGGEDAPSSALSAPASVTPSAAPPASPSPAPTTAAPADPALAAAVDAARAFLVALVAEDHEAAYAVLAPRAQAELALADFADAREAKNASARSLGQSYELEGATGEPPSVTVSGSGRVADGTPVDIALPMVLVDQAWRVDAVPTAY